MSHSLRALGQSVELLRQLQQELPADKVEAQAYPTEWTVADVFSHLGSGAVILRRRFEDVRRGSEPDPGFNQSVWDEWNAKAPEAQVRDAPLVDLALLQALEGTDEAARASFQLSFGPFDLDFDGFCALRLGEHALHTWDVAVALDPAATLPPSSTDVLIGTLGRIAAFTGKPTGPERTRHVVTSDPERGFTVAVGADALELTAEDPVAAPDLGLPSEAFIRLVYGRLDPDHTPAVAGDPAVLDDLRAAFPGF